MKRQPDVPPRWHRRLPLRRCALVDREPMAVNQKAAIGTLAGMLLGSQSVVVLDAGIAVGAMARRFWPHTEPAMVINSLTAIRALERVDIDVFVFIIGGFLRHTGSGIAGHHVERALAEVAADTACVGCDGAVAGRGIWRLWRG